MAHPAAPGQDFASRVLVVVESIPPSKVMSYGDIAAAIGSRAPRAVGQVMAYYGFSGWHARMPAPRAKWW